MRVPCTHIPLFSASVVLLHADCNLMSGNGMIGSARDCPMARKRHRATSVCVRVGTTSAQPLTHPPVGRMCLCPSGTGFRITMCKSECGTPYTTSSAARCSCRVAFVLIAVLGANANGDELFSEGRVLPFERHVFVYEAMCWFTRPCTGLCGPSREPRAEEHSQLVRVTLCPGTCTQGFILGTLHPQPATGLQNAPRQGER